LVAIPVWSKAVDKFPDAKSSTVIYVVGQQFNWNARYADTNGAFPRMDMRLVSDSNLFGIDTNDVAAKDGITLAPANEIHVPINTPVIVYVSSKDVIHSFKIVAMRVCQDAIPGLRIPCWFVPTKTGKYQINCAQLCGGGHSAMSSGFLVVDTQADYDKWVKSKSAAATSPGGFE
jgi:cytochrome c oxidase subunit 2